MEEILIKILLTQEIKKGDRMKKKRDFWPLAKDFSQRFPHKISSLQATKESVEVLGVAYARNKERR